MIMSPLPKGGGTYCFLDGSRQRQGRSKTFYPLCNLNTLGNSFIILGRNVEQDKTMSCTRMITLVFLLLELFPFFLFEIDFMSAL